MNEGSVKDPVEIVIDRDGFCATSLLGELLAVSKESIETSIVVMPIFNSFLLEDSLLNFSFNEGNWIRCVENDKLTLDIVV